MPRITHGLTRKKQTGRVPKLYSVWVRMKQRCYDTNHHAYARYGGRGISVCNEWINDVVSFMAWAKQSCYREGLLLDRINNDGNYSPANCRFVTYSQSNRNRSVSLMVTAFNETKSLAAWTEDPRVVVSGSTLRKRLRLSGWSSERAMTTPSRVKAVERRGKRPAGAEDLPEE